jgi:hypothetical protein
MPFLTIVPLTVLVRQLLPPMLQASLIMRSVATMFEKDSTGRPITDFEEEEEEEEEEESTK